MYPSNRHHTPTGGRLRLAGGDVAFGVEKEGLHAPAVYVSFYRHRSSSEVCGGSRLSCWCNEVAVRRERANVRVQAK